MFCACCVLDFASRAVSLTLPRTSEPPPGIPYRDSPMTYWAVLLVVGTCALSGAVLSPAVLRVTRPRSEGPWSGVAGSQGPSQAFDDILPSLPQVGVQICTPSVQGFLCARPARSTKENLDVCRPSLLCLVCTVTPETSHQIPVSVWSQRLRA